MISSSGTSGNHSSMENGTDESHDDYQSNIWKGIQVTHFELTEKGGVTLLVLCDKHRDYSMV